MEKISFWKKGKLIVKKIKADPLHPWESVKRYAASRGISQLYWSGICYIVLQEVNMKKKIKDLTSEEKDDICSQNGSCYLCPLSIELSKDKRSCKLIRKDYQEEVIKL